VFQEIIEVFPHESDRRTTAFSQTGIGDAAFFNGPPVEGVLVDAKILGRFFSCERTIGRMSGFGAAFDLLSQETHFGDQLSYKLDKLIQHLRILF